MKDDARKMPLLGNFAIRIRQLKHLCGIPMEASLTIGFTGIPNEVFADDGSTPNTSNVTSDLLS
jgi:hypothetical protein